jgi:hypothetical protein
MNLLPFPTDPADWPKFDTTTYKALVGQRLLVGVCAVCGAAFVGCLLTGDNDMAKYILEAFLYFFAIGVLGVNGAQYGLQRFSSRELHEAKERARLASPANGTSVRVGEAGQVTVETAEHQAGNGNGQAAPELPAELDPDARPTGDARVDDERGAP